MPERKSRHCASGLDPAENKRKWELSRRRFLALAGFSGAIAAAAVLAPKAVNAGHAPTADRGGRGAGERRIRQWMMIIDLRRCDGCQSVDLPPQCTEACNIGHFAPEPMEWIEVYEHPVSQDGRNDPGDEQSARAFDGTYFLPTICMQCQNPPCVNVCPVGATWTTPEGITLIDQDRCIGCRLCMAACPYERRFFTWGAPPIPPEALFVEKSPEHQIPLKKGIVAKCDFCPEMARAGRLPFCAQACPNKAIYYGDFEEDLATNGEEVVRVSDYLPENNAYRYKEELGTRPRVYYIPGHGEQVGRHPRTEGRLPVRWAYERTVEGADTWRRAER